MTERAIQLCEERMTEWTAVVELGRAPGVAEETLERYCSLLIRLGDRCERYGYGGQE